MTKANISGVRVWRGYRKLEHLDGEMHAFEKQLKSIFIPQTAQQLEPLGLLNYFPVLVPKKDCRGEVRIPDELALVVYPSKTHYQRAQTSVAGKAYGALHSTAFNFNHDLIIPASRSDAPTTWSKAWEFDRSYCLCGEEIDWGAGSTSVLLAKPAATLSVPSFREAVINTVSEWQERRSEAINIINASILCVNEDWLLYWEHSQSTEGLGAENGSLIPKLRLLLEEPYVFSQARKVTVPPVFTFNDDGVECNAGELMSVFVGDSNDRK